jgi:hypothetical protein
VKTILLIATFTAIGLAQPTTPEASQEDMARLNRSLERKAARLTDQVRKRAQEALATATPNPYSNVLVTQITHQPITWNLDASICSAVKFPLTGKGLDKSTLTILQNQDGTYNYEILDEVNGTVTDTKGNQYIFIYRRPQFIAQGNAFPQALLPYTFTGPDYFQLIPVGPGGTPGYSVNIFFNGHIGADGSFTDLGTIADNDPNCDPI